MLRPRPPAPAWLLCLFAMLAVGHAWAQITVPTLGTRGDVPAEVVAAVTDGLRTALTAEGLEVRPGELITAGIAGSLEPEFTRLIAEIDGSRYAVSGEVASASDGAPQPYLVNLIVVEAGSHRATDLISVPLAGDAGVRVGAALAGEIAAFAQPLARLPDGDAGVFVSSEPRGASLTIDAVPVGATPEAGALQLAPGRYLLELRAEGFLPETRSVELRAGETSFVHVVMTSISGGSIRLQAQPAARVYLDDEPAGTTPLTLPARTGSHEIRLERDGFLPRTLQVPVRTYRVTRVDAELDPRGEPLLFWPETRGTLVRIDGRLQSGGWAEDLRPGLRRIELIGPDGRHEVLRAVPARGLFRLDLESGELIPYRAGR